MKFLYPPDWMTTHRQYWVEWTYKEEADGSLIAVSDRPLDTIDDLRITAAALQDDAKALQALRVRFEHAVSAGNVDDVKLFAWLLERIGGEG